MLIETPDQYEEAVQLLNAKGDPIAWDLETTGKDWRKDRLVGIGSHVVRDEQEHSFYMPFRHREGTNLPEELIRDFWSRVLHPGRPQIFWHGSFDTKVAAHHDGYELPEDENFEDGILGALLANENEPSFKMEDVMVRYIDKNAGEADKDLADYLHDRFGGSRKEVKQHLWKAPAKIVAPYGCQDVKSTRQLRDFYREQLAFYKFKLTDRHGETVKRTLLDLWQELNAFQLDIVRMELRGILINRARLPMLYIEAEENAERLEEEIRADAGYPMNLNSSKQVQAWLGVKSSAKAVLKRMPDDPRAAKLLEWRQWNKAIGMYYEPYTRYMDDLGVMRPNIHITSPGVLTRGKSDSRNGTIAGRMSGSHPNLQQIPRGSESYRVKELFVARPGYILVELDYSQSQLRWAAHLSKDKRLTEILLSGGDMHSIVAQELDIPRPIAKNINFSAWFGIGYPKLSKLYYIPIDKARDYLSRYHKLFPGIRRLSTVCEHRATEKGYVRAFTGRMRHYNCLEAPAYRASNNLIQLCEAEMMRIAFMRTRREVPECHQVLQVHDSIWFEVPEAEPMKYITRLRGIMQDVPWCSLPMLVDAKGGPGFAKAKLVEFPRGPEGIPAAQLARVTDYDAVFGAAA